MRHRPTHPRTPYVRTTRPSSSTSPYPRTTPAAHASIGRIRAARGSSRNVVLRTTEGRWRPAGAIQYSSAACCDSRMASDGRRRRGTDCSPPSTAVGDDDRALRDARQPSSPKRGVRVARYGRRRGARGSRLASDDRRRLRSAGSSKPAAVDGIEAPDHRSRRLSRPRRAKLPRPEGFLSANYQSETN